MQKGGSKKGRLKRGRKKIVGALSFDSEIAMKKN